MGEMRKKNVRKVVKICWYFECVKLHGLWINRRRVLVFDGILAEGHSEKQGKIILTRVLFI